MGRGYISSMYRKSLGMVVLLSAFPLWGEVWYVPGWLRCHVPQGESMEMLRSLFPEEQVRYYDWEGNSLHWGASLRQADLTARRLADEVERLAPEARGRLTLVGHSLGGRIVARVLAELSRRHLEIRQGVLLGAAIPYDDDDLSQINLASREPVLNFINPDDVLLKYCYGPFGGEAHPALGANGILVPQENYQEHVVSSALLARVDFHLPVMHFSLIKRIANHHAKFYLHCWKELLLGTSKAEEQRVVIPQERLNLTIPTLGGHLLWSELESCNGWRLQKNLLTGHCRILDAQNTRRAWGRESTMRSAFQKVRRQLERQGNP